MRFRPASIRARNARHPDRAKVGISALADRDQDEPTGANERERQRLRQRGRRGPGLQVLEELHQRHHTLLFSDTWILANSRPGAQGRKSPAGRAELLHSSRVRNRWDGAKMQGVLNQSNLVGPFTDLIESLPDGVVIVTQTGSIVAANAHFAELSGYARDDLVGASIESLVPGRVRAQHVALRSAYVAEGGGTRAMSERLDIVLRHATGAEVPVDISLSTFGVGDDQLVLAAVRDASVRRRAELQVEREKAYVVAMHSISAALLGGGGIDETLRTISKHARAIFEADLTVVAVPSDDAQTMVFLFCDGHGAESLEGSTVPNDGSLSATVMREREPALLTDAATDSRLHRPPAWPADIGPALFVPLFARDETLGSLIIAKRQGGSMFRVDAVLAMQTFAAQAALALADARAQDALRGLRVLEDRDRVAAAMRDTVVSRLSSSSLTLHALLRDELPEPIKQRMWDVIDELDGAISAIRSAVFPR